MPVTRRLCRAGIALVGAGTGLWLTGCGGGAGILSARPAPAAPTIPSTTSPAVTAATTAPTTPPGGTATPSAGDTAAVTAAGSGWAGPSAGEDPVLAGRVLVVVGTGGTAGTGGMPGIPPDPGPPVLRGVDPADGRVRWSHPLPPVAGNPDETSPRDPFPMAGSTLPGGHGLVVLSYTETHPSATAIVAPPTPTVTAVDAGTGTTLWTATGVTGRPVAADARTVLLETPPSGVFLGDTDTHAVGLDTATGKTLWTSTKITGLVGLAGGSVIGSTAAIGDDLVALDEVTGRQRWTTKPADTRSFATTRPVGIAPAGLVSLDDGRVVLRDPATGRVLARQARASDVTKENVHLDGPSGTVVVLDPKAGLLGLALPDLRQSWDVAADTIPHATVTLVGDGTLVLTSQTRLDARTGRVLPGQPPAGQPLLVVGRYGITVDQFGTLTGTPLP